MMKAILLAIRFWLKFHRMKPGEWRQIGPTSYVVRYTGDLNGIAMAAKRRFPRAPMIATNEMKNGWWWVVVPETLIVEPQS